MIILPSLQQKVINDSHVGMSQMKSLGRAFVWWPGLDKQIEDTVNTSNICQSSRALPVHPWNWPT